MKSLVITLTMLLSITVSASSTRQMCENAYYATGYTKLHQYNIVVNWAKISDHALIKLENIIYSDAYKVLFEKEMANNKTLYTLKETAKSDPTDYEILLRDLELITGNSATCVYDI